MRDRRRLRLWCSWQYRHQACTSTATGRLPFQKCSGWTQCHSYPVTPLFDIVRAPTRPWPAGLILGYASLTIEQIQQGILTLASVIAEMGSR
jgi:hypothetical protein